MQLLTLFYVGEFEYSLVHAHQGFRRHRRTALEHGILQGNEIVEDCVGRNTHPKVLQLLSPWIRNLEEHRKLMIEKLKEEVDELDGKTPKYLLLIQLMTNIHVERKENSPTIYSNKTALHVSLKKSIINC